MAQETVSVSEAARILGIGRNVAYRLAAQGTIPALRLGRQLRIPLPALQDLLRSPSHRAAAATGQADPAPGK